MNHFFRVLTLSVVIVFSGIEQAQARYFCLFPGDQKCELTKQSSCYPEMELIENAAQHYFQGSQDEIWYLEQTASVLNNYRGCFCPEQGLYDATTGFTKFIYSGLRNPINLSVCPEIHEEAGRCDVYHRIRENYPVLSWALSKNINIFAPFQKLEGHWVVYTLEWVKNSLSFPMELLPKKLVYLIHTGWLDGHINRRAQFRRTYARHYFVRKQKKLCTSFYDTNAVFIRAEGNTVVTDFEFDLDSGFIEEHHALMSRPGKSTVWLRCMEADEQDSEVFQVETLLSDKAWSHHHQTTDKQQIADWVRKKRQGKDPDSG